MTGIGPTETVSSKGSSTVVSSFPKLQILKPLYLIIAVVVLSHAAYAGTRFSITLYALELQASPLIVGVLLSLFSLLPMVGSVPMGRLVDRRGMRAPLLAGTLTLVLCTLTAAFAGSLTWLFLVAAAAGAAYFSVLISAQQLVGRYGEPAERTNNFVLLGMCFSISSMIVPVVAGFLIDHAGFRYAFLATTLFPVFAAIIVAARMLPNMGPSATANAAVTPATKPDAGSKQAAGGVLGLIREPALRRLYVYGIVFTVSWDVFLFLTPIFGAQLKLSASQIGIIVGCYSTATLVVRLFSRRLTRSFTSWQLLLMSLTGLGLGCLAYGFAGTASLLMACAFIMGFGHGMATPTLNTLLYEFSPPNRIAEAMGLRLSIGKVFQISLPLVSGAVSTLFGVAPMFWAVSAIQLGTVFATRAQWHAKATR